MVNFKLHLLNIFLQDSEVLVSPPPFKYNEDYRVQEEIRNVERFTPQFNTYRTTGRRKRTIYQGHNVKPKVQAVFEDDLRYAVPKVLLKFFSVVSAATSFALFLPIICIYLHEIFHSYLILLLFLMRFWNLIFVVGAIRLIKMCKKNSTTADSNL